MGDPTPFLDGKDAKLLALAAITLVAFLAYAAVIGSPLSLFTPLLFYFPIILAAYWFPRNGVVFAVAVGILEVFSVYFHPNPDLSAITLAITTASFYVLVAVAVVISSLSGERNEREARYRGIFDNSDAGIFIARNGEDDLVIEEVNQRGSAILMEHARDLVGKKFTDFWRDEPSRRAFLGEMESSGTVPQLETTLVRADGSTVPVLISGARLPKKTMVLMVIDISGRIAQEKELQEKNRQLSLLNKVIADASTAPDTASMMGSVLAHARESLGCDTCGVSLFREGQTPSLFSSGDAGLLDAMGGREWEDAMKGVAPLAWGRKYGGGREGIPGAGMVVPLRSGETLLGTFFVISRDPDFHAAEGLVRALAGEIAAATTRISLMEQLAEANRQANLYLDILMHDINNANLASLWYGDLLLEMLSGEAATIARKMREGIRKSREIIRNVETIRKVHGKRPELRPVDLDAVIKKEIRAYPDVAITYSGLPVKVWADELLGEVFANLIGNSVKFGGYGVKICVSVERPTQEKVVVTVSDNGPGIPDDLKNVIFMRFSKIEPGEHGKGLGLYIAKMLASRYGGDISVCDRIPGDHSKGASFRVELRAVKDS
ncbi:MAG: ATP-binding protein [Methanolinea sp.]|nr:ATP-binding protein [Methanolinea sp.]